MVCVVDVGAVGKSCACCELGWKSNGNGFEKFPIGEVIFVGFIMSGFTVLAGGSKHICFRYVRSFHQFFFYLFFVCPVLVYYLNAPGNNTSVSLLSKNNGDLDLRFDFWHFLEVLLCPFSGSEH